MSIRVSPRTVRSIEPLKSAGNCSPCCRRPNSHASRWTRSRNITKVKMPQISVAPTRTNLIRLKKDLRFAREGYEILDRKREALTTELVSVAKEADLVQK